MSKRTANYNFYSLELGDKWYAGLDYENFITTENQFEFLQNFVGPCIISGWTVEKLSQNRSDQLSLIGGYLNDSNGDFGTKLKSLNLNFTSDFICAAGSTANINLTGGTPNYLDGISLSLNDQILVKDQDDKSQNGVYIVSTLGTGSNGTWTRSSILNTSSDFNSNFIVYVQAGTSNTSTLWLGASLGTTFGNNDLYFIDPFEQCIKVSNGSGIVDKYFGKTDKANYFRFTNYDDVFIWAEKTLNITFNNVAKITAPLPPYFKYGTDNKAAYLATVSSSAGSTLYDAATIDQIVYGINRNNYNDATGEFQKSLNFNYLKHKHLGNLYTAEQINLNNSEILSAKNSYQNQSVISSPILYLYTAENNLFNISDLPNYGIPKVYLNNNLLNDSEYRFVADNKLYLKNSILNTDVVQVVLPKFTQKELICIDSNGSAIASTLSSIDYVFLSDGTLEDRTPDDKIANLVYKNFSWSNSYYLESVVYSDSEKIDKKYYTIYPDSGRLKFSSSYPNLASTTYNQIKIKIDGIGSEIQNKLDGSRLQNLSASSISKGAIGISNINNLSHNYYLRYKENAEFNFNKFLISGSGNSYFYPENTFSDLQFNTEVYHIFKSNNSEDKSILFGTALGLLNSDTTFKNIKVSNSWKNDAGKPVLILDDLLKPDSENYFNTSYLLTKLGHLYYKTADENKWIMMKTPSSSGIAFTVSSFDVSTDRVTNSKGEETYSTYIYAGINSGVYIANYSDVTKEDSWEWRKIDFYDSSKISSISNINSISELCTKNINIGTSLPDDITFDRSLYVASTDASYPGLYYGNESIVKRIVNDNCIGVYVITDGQNNFNKNNIIWWNDYDAYITHTSYFYDLNSEKYWDHPFSIDSGSYTSCDCATTANISLSGLQTIDGFSLTAGNRVLVKNQTNSIENGIYIAASGSWSRSSDLNNNSEFTYGKKVEITNGTLQSGSIWFLKYSDTYEIGTTEINWDIYKFKIYSTSTPTYSATRSKIKSIIYRQSDLNLEQYIVSHTDGLALVTDSSIPTYKELVYEKPFQGLVNSVYSQKSSNANGEVFVATEYGIYQSTDYLWTNENLLTDISLLKYAWKRTENLFLSNDTIRLFEISSLDEASSFEKFHQWQLLRFDSQVDIDKNYYYERSFNDFYINPWINDFTDDNGNQTEYQIIVYLDSKPTNIPFYTDSETGLIRFVNSVPIDYINKVYVSLSSKNQFVSEIGERTHEEIFMGANKVKPVARLSSENLPSENIIYLNQTIDINEKVLLLEYNGTREVVYVESINNYKSPVEVEIFATRSQYNSNFTFPISTTVYSLKDSLSSNILDDLYYLISKEKYNLGSINNANIGLLSLELDEKIATLYDINPAAPFSQTDTRGLKNNLNINNLVNHQLYDNLKSSLKYNVGSPNDPEIESFDVTNINDIDNLSKNCLNSLCVTDRGIWKYNSARWINIERFDKITSYFIKEKSDQSFVVGTSNGLYNISKDYIVSKNTSFNQEIYDFIDGYFDNIKFEAYAKSDGMLISQNPSSANFTAECSSLVDNTAVYGLSKASGIRISNGSEQLYDILYISSESGFYGLCTGSSSDLFTANYFSKKLISNNPEGVTRYFSSFVPYQIPTIPINNNASSHLFILTNDGILRTNNYKWCDPLISNSELNIDQRFLRGLECTCYITDFENSIDNVKPGKSKIFIGTNRGVYRSLNGGLSFEKTERINTTYPSINSLKLFESTFLSGASNITKNVLVASTNIGFYYSIDDGDNWYKLDESTENSEQPILCSSFPSDKINISNSVSAGNYLAQTLIADKTGIIDKVSVYLKVNNDLNNIANYDISLTGNSINAYLCGLTIDGKPDLTNILDTSSSNGISPESILNDEYTFFEFNYNINQNDGIAIVIREVLTSGGISLIQWVKSPVVNDSIEGFAYTRYDGTFVKLDSDNNDSSDYQYHFRCYYNVDNDAKEIEIAVGRNTSGSTGWNSGKINGAIINDSGHLTLDTKFLISLVVDDTFSMRVNAADSDYITKTKSLLSTLVDRTTNNTEYTGIDFWILTDSIERKTEGFVNDSTSVLSFFDILRKTGSYNDLNEALDLASVGMYPISVNEIFKKENDTAGNKLRIQDIVDYLTSINSLRLNDLITDYNNLEETDGWDLTSNNIYQSDLASKLLLDRFSKTYVPILLCVTDGENSSSIAFDDIVENAKNYWNDLGFKLIICDLSELNMQGQYKKLLAEGNGYHYQIKSDIDWDNAIISMIHGGNNNLFKGYWTKSYTYNDPQFIDRIFCSFVKNNAISKPSDCVIEYRYTADEITSDWIQLKSDVFTNINKKVSSLEYKISLTQGWDGTSIVNPTVTSLYHVEINPSEMYLFTDNISTIGYINEIIISPNISDNKNVEIEWGLNKENSIKWSNYQYFPELRNAVLSNRQKTYRTTEQKTYQNITFSPIDNELFKFNTLNEGSLFKWSDNSSISIYSNNILLSPNAYRVDNNIGVVVFDSPQNSYSSLSATIVEYENIYQSFGENTFTTNYRTYFAENGPWSNNDNVVVFVNDVIQRKDYILDKFTGAVTFKKQLEKTDIVSIYLNEFDQFRLALKIKNYSLSNDNIYNFAFQYTTLKNQNKLSELTSVTKPYLNDNRVILKTDITNQSNDITTKSPIIVDYNFKSDYDTQETDSITSWWIKKTNTFTEITFANGFPNYNNRTIQRQIDLNNYFNYFSEGDEIYVQIQPKDKYKLGNSFQSEIYILNAFDKPYVSDVKIRSNKTIASKFVAAESELTAFYLYKDPDDNGDESIVEWYDWSISSISIYTGSVLPAAYVKSGSMISFIVQPYNGNVYGNKIESNTIYIT